MATCEVCGNEYGPSFEVQIQDKQGVFENFEWIIQSPSPNCAHCGCQVMGHGAESTDFFSAILVAPLVVSSLAVEDMPGFAPQPQAERNVSPLARPL
jgi:hypothetical protein